MGLWDSHTQISAIFRSPVKIKLLIHYVIPSSPFLPSAHLFSQVFAPPPQHHEVDFGLTHKAKPPIVRVRKRKFLSAIKSLF